MAPAKLTYTELSKDIITVIQQENPRIKVKSDTSLGSSPLNYDVLELNNLAGRIKAMPFFPNSPKISVGIQDARDVLAKKKASVKDFVDMFANKLKISIPNSK